MTLIADVKNQPKQVLTWTSLSDTLVHITTSKDEVTSLRIHER